MREYQYVVDRDGRVFHDGTELVDPLTLRFFLRAMTVTADGRYLVVCQGEHNWFATDDTPFVVQRVRLTPQHPVASHASGDRPMAVELCFPGDYREPLDPETLEAHHGDLFCRVRGGAFRARFGRVALQQLAPYLADDRRRVTLVLGANRYTIREPAT
ncbi:MAG TPA: hypothetical protein VGT40_16900 [Methylomirabilota bacterium]|jgi:hypothetical protein|nr:hypothetical protein [Methylomirabilota bacterium]